MIRSTYISINTNSFKDDFVFIMVSLALESGQFWMVESRCLMIYSIFSAEITSIGGSVFFVAFTYVRFCLFFLLWFWGFGLSFGRLLDVFLGLKVG